jgi:hypothetical protein
MAKRKEHQIRNSIEYKHCGRCNEWLELQSFSKVSRNWDKLNSNCKKCQYQYMKNSPSVKEYRKQYAIKNKALLSEKRKKRTHSLSGKFSSYKSEAARRSLKFELSIEEFQALWQQPCYYCNVQIKTIGIDRIDNAIGYDADNTTSCCNKCNVAKNDMSREEFLSMIKRIYLNHC